jgi:hypothetical protein
MTTLLQILGDDLDFNDVERYEQALLNLATDVRSKDFQRTRKEIAKSVTELLSAWAALNNRDVAELEETIARRLKFRQWDTANEFKEGSKSRRL